MNLEELCKRAHDVRIKAGMLDTNVKNETLRKAADAILVYSAIQSEADLDLFCKKAWADEKKLYFPKVFGEKMDFFCVSDASQLTSGAFHVMEPDVDTYVLETFQSTQVQVPILVPGVAFSRRGERIGYGKGYYDRYIGMRPAVVSQGIESTLAVHVGVGPSVGVGSFPIIEPVGRKKRHPLVFLVGIHSVVAPCVGIVVHVYSHEAGTV